MLSFRISAILMLSLIAAPTRADELSREELKFFETRIRPVLVRECYGCHSNKSGNVRGGLRLDTKQLMLIGGGSGPAIVPGKPEDSWLYNAITHQDFVMPPKRKLPKNVIDDFRKWIEMGAPDPRVNAITKVNSKITPEDIKQAKAAFWAYKKPVKTTAHAVENTAWPKTEIDRFVLAKLEQADLKPAADAEPRNVLRRLNFDLIGLPPSPQEIKSFTASWKQDPDRAVAAVVDRLLETKQYGERWGRHWLDVARFAESTGTQVNMTYPQAWRYRDYVIDSFNDDKPYDRFVQEQIAGDLLPVKTDEQWAENLVATTFLAVGSKNVNEQNPVQFAANVADEQIDATTRVFMGMSVACARCHDHKFDAIPQADYYAMAGIFQNMKTYWGSPQSEFGSFSGAQSKQNSTLLILPVADPSPFDVKMTKQELENLKEQLVAKRSEMSQMRRGFGQSGNSSANIRRQRASMLSVLGKMSAKIAAVDENGNPHSFSMGVQEVDSPADAHLLVRGEIDQRAQKVKRGFPQVLTSKQPLISSKSSGRRELARWIGSEDNPLTARVMVNRIWLHLIGNGIVTSTENFGTTGQMPSHPELLDYLAVRFVESGWSMKSIIRLIATSRVYRMQSTFNEEHHEYDPGNALIWRANPRRLDAEAIRDAMLTVSGEIDLQRPPASEVAKAGYVRVRNGQLTSGSGRGQFGGRPQPGAGGQDGQRFRQGQRRQQGRFQPGGQRRPQSGGQNRSQPGGQGFRGRRPDGSQGFRGRRPGGSQGRQSGFAGRPTNPLDMENAKYRSVYLPIVRDEEPRSLAVFDFGDSSAIVGRREASSTANQSLYMMNNPFVIQQSKSFAGRISTSGTQTKQIEQAFLLAYGRLPTSAERAGTIAFIRKFSPSSNRGERGKATMAAICQSLFASAEFRFVD